MASTYVNNLRLEEIGSGEQSGTWGDTTNTNLKILGQTVAWGTRAIADASTDNITIADGALDADRCLGLKLTGGGQACTVTLLPNTSSKTWFMYNATSAALTFTCGSGANVIIPAGQTKVIATDGLGSGGVVHDLLTAVNLAGATVVDDLTVSDDLTVTDDMTVGGTLGVTGVLTGTSLDISGDIDVDGTTNLDVVDIDGAVDMASTLQVDGAVTTSSTASIAGHASIGVDAVASTRALTVAGATDGSGSSIIVGYNSSLAAKFSVRDDGFVSVGNGLSLADGNLTVASGHGIDFSATGDGAGTDSSELFDDYEEGTFTPTFGTDGVASGAGYSEQVGRYTKVGRHVYYEISINLSSGTANSSHVKISGLPYTANSAAPYGGAYIIYQQSFETDIDIAFLNVADSTSIAFYNYATGASYVGTDANAITALLRINGHYMT